MDKQWTVFGERLRAELERQGMSYRTFSAKVGLTLTTTCRYAKSERVPRANEILKTAKVLGVTCDYLLGLSDDPHKTSKSSRMIEKEQKWIPVSERMPEFDEGKILGCDQFGQIFIPTSIIKIEEKLYDAKDFKFDVNEFLKGRYIVGGIRMRPRIIVAWMPLPEPYKGEKE